MNNKQFVMAMEHFGEAMNIPMRDLLVQIQNSGQTSLMMPENERPDFLMAEFIQYQSGFKSPLPEGTKSIYELHDHSESE